MVESIMPKTLGKRRSKVYQVIRNGIIFELQAEPEGGYTISVPSLPGCLSHGKSFEEAFDMIKDAMEGWLSVAREEGVPLPEKFEDIKLAFHSQPKR